MSHKATNWAFDQPERFTAKKREMKPIELVVLLVLADCHNAEKGCFPSHKYIAKRSNLEERSVRRTLHKLKCDRQVVYWENQREDGHRGSNRYTLAFEPDFDISNCIDPETESEQTKKLPDQMSASPTGQKTPKLPDKNSDSYRTGCPPNPVIEPVNRTTPPTPNDEKQDNSNVELGGVDSIFDVLWEEWKKAKIELPHSKQTAYNRFFSLPDDLKLAIPQAQLVYRKICHRMGNKPLLIKFFDSEIITPLVDAPDISDKGRFIITPQRPEWQDWINHFSNGGQYDVINHLLLVRRYDTETRYPGQALKRPEGAKLHSLAKFGSEDWVIHRLQRLMAGVEKTLPPMTAMMRRLSGDNPKYQLEHQAKYGWPKLANMDANAMQGAGWMIISERTCSRASERQGNGGGSSASRDGFSVSRQAIRPADRSRDGTSVPDACPTPDIGTEGELSNAPFGGGSGEGTAGPDGGLNNIEPIGETQSARSQAPAPAGNGRETKHNYEKIAVGSDRWEEFQALHDANGWPRMPEPKFADGDPVIFKLPKDFAAIKPSVAAIIKPVGKDPDTVLSNMAEENSTLQKAGIPIAADYDFPSVAGQASRFDAPARERTRGRMPERKTS